MRWARLCELSLGFDGSSNSQAHECSHSVDFMVSDLPISREELQEHSIVDVSARSEGINGEETKLRRCLRMLTTSFFFLIGGTLIIEMIVGCSD